MKVLLTGATGFIGQALIVELLKTGHQVRAFVRKYSSILPVEVEQIVGDLSGLPQDNMIFNRIDIVLHAAARVHVMYDQANDPLSEYRKVNRDATLALAQMAAEAGVERFVFLSSIGVNGNSTTKPFIEVDNEDPCEPYAVSKYEAEQELLVLAKETDMEVVIIRPPLVYGANAPGNFASLLSWMSKCVPLPFGAVKNQRSFIALDNLVSFIICCVHHPKAANQIFLISDGEDVSTTELLKKVAKAFAKRALLLPVPVGWMVFAAKWVGKEDVANRLFGSLQVDSSKARELLGWEPIITMDEQLKKTAEAYLNEKTV